MRHPVLILVAVAALCIDASAQTAAPEDPSAMSRSELQNEVRASRPFLRHRGVQPGGRPPGCISNEARQLDFWIGEWDVSPTGSPMVLAESSITLRDQGCVIIEEWRPFGQGSAHSLSAFDSSTGKWRQAYVGSTGTWTFYQGELDGAVMRLNNESATNQRSRMNYQALDGDTVRQWGETYDATTSQWVVAWDFTYRRRSGSRR